MSSEQSDLFPVPAQGEGNGKDKEDNRNGSPQCLANQGSLRMLRLGTFSLWTSDKW